MLFAHHREWPTRPMRDDRLNTAPRQLMRLRPYAISDSNALFVGNAFTVHEVQLKTAERQFKV